VRLVRKDGSQRRKAWPGQSVLLVRSDAQTGMVRSELKALEELEELASEKMLETVIQVSARDVRFWGAGWWAAALGRGSSWETCWVVVLEERMGSSGSSAGNVLAEVSNGGGIHSGVPFHFFSHAGSAVCVSSAMAMAANAASL